MCGANILFTLLGLTSISNFTFADYNQLRLQTLDYCRCLPDLGPQEADIVTHHCHERREEVREERRAGALPGAAPARGQGAVHLCVDRWHWGESQEQDKDSQLYPKDTKR